MFPCFSVQMSSLRWRHFTFSPKNCENGRVSEIKKLFALVLVVNNNNKNNNKALT